MDLVGVTRAGRLAVLELKAGEDLQLVLQAVGYWLRVRWHHAQQDFPRYGYFPGITLDPRPPLLFLVAPSLRFHPANDVLLRYLSKEIEICRVGVSEHWRRGLKVVLRQERDSNSFISTVSPSRTGVKLDLESGPEIKEAASALAASCFPGCVLEVI